MSRKYLNLMNEMYNELCEMSSTMSNKGGIEKAIQDRKMYIRTSKCLLDVIKLFADEIEFAKGRCEKHIEMLDRASGGSGGKN